MNCKTAINSAEVKQRTKLQNRAMHLWFRQCAECLNDSGLDMLIFFERINFQLNLDWTDTAFKEKIWKYAQQDMLDKESTAELDTAEPSQICLLLTKAIAEQTGVTLPPWPDRFNQTGE